MNLASYKESYEFFNWQTFFVFMNGLKLFFGGLEENTTLGNNHLMCFAIFLIRRTQKHLA